MTMARKTMVCTRLAGALLGGIIHIAVILILPNFANRDAFTSVGRFGPDVSVYLLPMAEPGTAALPGHHTFSHHTVRRAALAPRPAPLTPATLL